MGFDLKDPHGFIIGDLRVEMAREVADHLTGMGYGATQFGWKVHFYSVGMDHSECIIHFHPDAIKITYGNEYKVSYDDLGDPKFFENVALKAARIMESRRGHVPRRKVWRDGS